MLCNSCCRASRNSDWDRLLRDFIRFTLDSIQLELCGKIVLHDCRSFRNWSKRIVLDNSSSMLYSSRSPLNDNMAIGRPNWRTGWPCPLYRRSCVRRSWEQIRNLAVKIRCLRVKYPHWWEYWHCLHLSGWYPETHILFQTLSGMLENAWRSPKCWVACCGLSPNSGRIFLALSAHI